jgi:hypothetical protein
MSDEAVIVDRKCVFSHHSRLLERFLHRARAANHGYVLRPCVDVAPRRWHCFLGGPTARLRRVG